MAKVIFIEGTKDYHKRVVAKRWFVLWILVFVMLVVYLWHPDWFVIPPFVHNIKVSR